SILAHEAHDRVAHCILHFVSGRLLPDFRWGCCGPTPHRPLLSRFSTRWGTSGDDEVAPGDPLRPNALAAQAGARAAARIGFSPEIAQLAAFSPLSRRLRPTGSEAAPTLAPVLPVSAPGRAAPR